MALANTYVGPERITQLLADRRRLFFIGIGGVSMHCLALLARRRGFAVGGSDRNDSPLLDTLREAGAEVWIGHDAAHVEGYDAVVYTVAIAEDNPEYVAALAAGMPVLSRADFLGYMMYSYKERIGVSGMHGKSTTTAMLHDILVSGGCDPTVVSGAQVSPGGTCYRLGGEDCFLFEGCEYMRSFHAFSPTVAVLLNLELDHTDCYADLGEVQAAFAAYLERIPDGGVAVLNADDPPLLEAACGYRGRRVTFSLSGGEADVRATCLAYEAGRPRFTVQRGGKTLGEISLTVCGRHNAENALAACTAALEAGVPFPVIRAALASFVGAHRRMEERGVWRGAHYFDDYAHHPTEIAATLCAARQMAEGRLLCVFQSHTYSRTAQLFDGFVSALQAADGVVILPIYAARETDTRGMSEEVLAAAVGTKACAAKDFADAARRIQAMARPGDTVLIMGAGNVDRVFDHLAE